jgi:hypothetical protein
MWSTLKSWLKAPYSSDMDALHWFYFLGLFLVLLALWSLVLRTIKEAL